MQEASTVGEVGKIFHQINAVLEDWQEDHWSTIVDIEGFTSNQMISIIIDRGDTLSYITPKMMENWELAKVKHAKPWLV